MKKFVAGLLCGLLIAASVTAFAAGSIRLIINGVDVTDDLAVELQVMDDEVIAPLSAIVEALGAVIEFDEESNSVTISNTRLGLDDVFMEIPPDEVITVMDLMEEININIMELRGLPESAYVAFLFSTFEPDIAFFMLLNDYLSWSEDGNADIAMYWEKLFIVN